MDRSAHPFIHSSIHVLEIFFSEHKQNTTEDTTQVHHRKNKVFETVTRDIEARARKERDEPRKMVSPIHQFTYPPTHLLTQSPIHPTSPHPFLTWLQLYSYSKCPPPSLILIVIKLQIFVHTDDVCGQGTQCDGQHWRQGFEN